jgi:hypothetical protein
MVMTAGLLEVAAPLARGLMGELVLSNMSPDERSSESSIDLSYTEHTARHTRHTRYTRHTQRQSQPPVDTKAVRAGQD